MPIAFRSAGRMPTDAPESAVSKRRPVLPVASAQQAVANRPPGAFPLAGRSPLRGSPMSFWPLPTVARARAGAAPTATD
jgi:hypothetical protein